MKSLIILVGASGSGKSSWSRGRSDADAAVVCSADDYFMDTLGVYRFSTSLLGQAHGACQARARDAMLGGAPLVVIDNTNTTVEEVGRYLTGADIHGYEVQILVFRSELDPEVLARRNKHGVPVHAIQGQLDRIARMLASWPFDWPRYEVR